MLLSFERKKTYGLLVDKQKKWRLFFGRQQAKKDAARVLERIGREINNERELDLKLKLGNGFWYISLFLWTN